MAYPTDLTDMEWNTVKDLFEWRADTRGNKGKHSVRHLVNACLYRSKTGCQWVMLPTDFPPRSTVFQRFRVWSNHGMFDKAQARLVELCRLKKTEM